MAETLCVRRAFEERREVSPALAESGVASKAREEGCSSSFVAEVVRLRSFGANRPKSHDFGYVALV